MTAMHTNSPWIVGTFVFYITSVYALAFLAQRFARGRNQVEEYYLGSRDLGIWTLALTFAATSASAGSFTGFPALIYTHGWPLALWISGYMIFPLCTMGLFGKRLNHVARKSDAITLPDIFRDRFDRPWLGLMTTLFLLFFLVVYLIPQFKAGGVLTQTLLQDMPVFQVLRSWLDGAAASVGGVSSGYLAGLLLFSGAVVIYTAVGGFRADVHSDVLQGIIMGFGVVIMLPLTLYAAYVYLNPAAPSAAPESAVYDPYAGMAARHAEPFRLSQLPEGLEKVNQHLLRTQPDALTVQGQVRKETPEGPQFDPFLPLGLAISFFFLWPIAGAGQAGNMLRLMAFRDSRVLSRAIFTVTVFYALIYLPFVLIFVSAKTLPVEVEQPDQIMPAMAIFTAPPVLAGLLLAAPFAAIMSTVDSFLLMISSALLRDLYQRNFNPKVPDRTLKKMALATTFAVGMLVMALAVNPPRFLQDLIIFGSASQAATLLAATALMLYWPRANATGTACAMITGFSTVALMYLIGRIQTGEFLAWTPLNLHPFIWGLMGSAIGGVCGTLLSTPPEKAIVNKYFMRG